MRLKDISYIDHPELRIDEHESTEMPFRYMVNSDGTPVMPQVRSPILFYSRRILSIFLMSGTTLIQGMVDLIRQDSEKGFGDLL